MLLILAVISTVLLVLAVLIFYPSDTSPQVQDPRPALVAILSDPIVEDTQYLNYRIDASIIERYAAIVDVVNEQQVGSRDALQPSTPIVVTDSIISTPSNSVVMTVNINRMINRVLEARSRGLFGGGVVDIHNLQSRTYLVGQGDYRRIFQQCVNASNVRDNISNVPASALLVFYVGNGADLVPSDDQGQIPLVFFEPQEYVGYTTLSSTTTFSTYVVQQTHNATNAIMPIWNQQVQTNNDGITYYAPLSTRQYNTSLAIGRLSTYQQFHCDIERQRSSLHSYLNCLDLRHQNSHTVVTLYRVLNNLFNSSSGIVGEWPVVELYPMVEQVYYTNVQVSGITTVSGERNARLLVVSDNPIDVILPLYYGYRITSQ